MLLTVTGLWLGLARFVQRIPVPLSVKVIAVVVSINLSASVPPEGALIPHIEWTTPTVTLPAPAGVALPLCIVTMASQTIRGVAVMAGLGYTVPRRPAPKSVVGSPELITARAT